MGVDAGLGVEVGTPVGLALEAGLDVALDVTVAKGVRAVLWNCKGVSVGSWAISIVSLSAGIIFRRKASGMPQYPAGSNAGIRIRAMAAAIGEALPAIASLEKIDIKRGVVDQLGR